MSNSGLEGLWNFFSPPLFLPEMLRGSSASAWRVSIVTTPQYLRACCGARGNVSERNQGPCQGGFRRG